MSALHFVMSRKPRQTASPRQPALIFLSLAFLMAVRAAPLQAGVEPAEAQARNVQTVKFFSNALNEDRAFNLILPLDYDTSTSRYPVLYLLHGYTGNNTDWTLHTNLSAYAAHYRLIIVMPDGSNGWYVNSAADPKAKFEDYIIKDVIPYTESHYRTIPLRRARAVAGLSMGGYGAMFLGLKHYQMFAALGSFSGALGVAAGIVQPPSNMTPAQRKSMEEIQSHFGPVGSATAKERDPFELAKKVPLEEMPKLYIAEGGEDFLIEGNRKFIDVLAGLKIPYEYYEVSPREHTWVFWDEQIRAFLGILADLQGFQSHTMDVPPGPRGPGPTAGRPEGHALKSKGYPAALSIGPGQGGWQGPTRLSCRSMRL